MILMVFEIFVYLMKIIFTEFFLLKNTRKFDLTLIKPWLLIIGLINYLIKFIIYYKNTSDFIKINVN
jgi:hypothetical protein